MTPTAQREREIILRAVAQIDEALRLAASDWDRRLAELALPERRELLERLAMLDRGAA